MDALSEFCVHTGHWIQLRKRGTRAGHQEEREEQHSLLVIFSILDSDKQEPKLQMKAKVWSSKRRQQFVCFCHISLHHAPSANISKSEI